AFGVISLSKIFTSVDLPEPDAPTMKTKSPFSITNETSFNAETSGSYTFVTLSNTIIVLGAALGRGAVSAAEGSIWRSVNVMYRWVEQAAAGSSARAGPSAAGPQL